MSHRVSRWAARAEEAGFSTLATIGRYAYPGLSDTVALAAAAGATTTIGLLSAVLIAPTWPGALLAKEIAGIDGVSGGHDRTQFRSGATSLAAGGPPGHPETRRTDDLDEAARLADITTVPA